MYWLTNVLGLVKVVALTQRRYLGLVFALMAGFVVAVVWSPVFRSMPTNTAALARISRAPLSVTSVVLLLRMKLFQAVKLGEAA